MRRFWNLASSAGGNELSLSVRGVIDGDMLDGESASARDLVAELVANPSAKQITVHIDSAGGSLFGGIAIYNALRSHRASVVSIIEGRAQRAASVIAMAGRTVMGKGTSLTLASPWGVSFGKANDHRKEADVLDKIKAGLVDIYSAKTGKSIDELWGMLNAETTFTSAEALKHRFADEINDQRSAKDVAAMHAVARASKVQCALLAGLNDRRRWAR